MEEPAKQPKLEELIEQDKQARIQRAADKIKKVLEEERVSIFHSVTITCDGKVMPHVQIVAQ